MTTCFSLELSNPSFYGRQQVDQSFAIVSQGKDEAAAAAPAAIQKLSNFPPVFFSPTNTKRNPKNIDVSLNLVI